MRRNMPLAKMQLRAILILWVLYRVAAPGAFADEPQDGAAVLRAMHDRYANNWYDTLTFQQDSITRHPEGKSG